MTKSVQVTVYESDPKKIEALRKKLWKTGLEIKYVPVIGPESKTPIEIKWEGGSATPTSLDEIPKVIKQIPSEKKDYGRIDDLYIEKKNGQIEVDMYPHKFVQIVEEKAPTKKNPDIKIDIAKFTKKDPKTGEKKDELNPARITYPDDYELSKVIKSVPSLYKKKYRCPLCEERAREILGKVDKIVSSDLSEADQEKELDGLINDMKTQNEEVRELKSDIRQANGETNYPNHHPLGPKYDYLYDKHDHMMGRFKNAKESLDTLSQSAVEMPARFLQTIFPPPDRLFNILKEPAIPQTSHLRGQQAVDNMPIGPPEENIKPKLEMKKDLELIQSDSNE